MATKVKPTRLNVTGVPQVGKVPTYVDKNTFAWGNGGGGGGYGRFLSLWDCSTGMPISFPEATPYTYLTGDYFLVEVVDSSDPATNYKPDGATYTGAASTTVESDSVAKGDVYVYDGTVWLLQSNSEKSVSFSNITGQPTDNLNLAADLNAKQDNLTAGNGIDIDASNKISTTFIYGESSTAAETVQKEVSIPTITELNVGQVIIVKPSTTSSVASSTLKLNSFPAYKMLYNGAEITTSTDSVVWSANVPSMFYLDEVSGTKYWRFLGHGLDSNSTYTLNQLIDAGRYEAGTGTYAITRYSLCMMKADGTWEKLTATNANYTTATTKTVNTNGFVLNQIKYYNTTTTVANGAFVGTNTFSSQAASVRADYSFNCGTAPGWNVGDPIYIVGTIGVDGLFYLDTTARWSKTLPSTNDGKLYIRIGTALTTTDATISFLLDRPIFYYDNGIKEYTSGKIDELETGLATKQDELVSGVNIRTINGTSVLGNGDITTPTGIPSQTGEAGKFLTTDGTSVSWGTVSAGVTSVNGNTGAVTVNDVKVAATAPASPTEGMAWYDTANDKLKSYDGANWNVVGDGDVTGPASSTDGHLAVFDGATGKIIKDGGAVPEQNVKVFTLSSTSDLVNAQAAYDWYVNGGYPVIYITGYVDKFVLSGEGNNKMKFSGSNGNGAVITGVQTSLSTVVFTISSGSVSSIELNTNIISVKSTAPLAGTPNYTITLVI